MENYKKLVLMLVILFGLAGCQTTSTETVDILNEQECDPGLGNANLIIGRIINPVVYGPCTGAKSGEVVRVKISVVNDGSTLGGLHFLSPEGK